MVLLFFYIDFKWHREYFYLTILAAARIVVMLVKIACGTKVSFVGWLTFEHHKL